MINKAISHLAEQMMKNQEAYIVAIEEHLTNICTNEKIAQKLLAEGKTVDGAFNAMKKKAEKAAKNGSACFRDEEGFQIVEEYYGITEEDKGARRSVGSAKIIDITDLL